MMDQYEIEIDLLDVVHYLLKKWWIIVASCVICAVLGLFVSTYVITPQYEASTRMYILSRSSGESVSYSDYQISDRMLADYKVLITGPNVTKQVVEELKVNMSVKDLEKTITVTAPENTRVVQIAVSSNDPKLAADIANCVRKVASEQIKEIMDVESVNLIYEADVPEEPVAPNILKWVIGASVLGTVLSVVVLCVRHLSDDSIRTEEDVERYLNMNVLGVIPKSEELGTMDVTSYDLLKHSRKGKWRRGA